MDTDDLFAVTDPPTRTAFVANPVTIVKNKIRDDFIIQTQLTQQIRHPSLLCGQDVLSQSPPEIATLTGASHQQLSKKLCSMPLLFI